MSQNDLQNSVGKPLIAANLDGIGEQIDACFLPLGLQREAGIGTWRYSGDVNGRSVTVVVAVRTRTQYLLGSIRYRKFAGLWLDVIVDTATMSRLSLTQPPGWIRGFSAFIQRLYGSKPVTNLSSIYEPFTVHAADPAWAEIFLADKAVQTQLPALVLNPNLPPGGAFFLSPGKWKWTTPVLPSLFIPEAVQIWLQQMILLAARAEQNPPLTAVQPNWIERQNSTVVAVVVAVAFLFGIPFLLFLCCFLPAMALIIWNGGL